MRTSRIVKKLILTGLSVAVCTTISQAQTVPAAPAAAAPSRCEALTEMTVPGEQTQGDLVAPAQTLPMEFSPAEIQDLGLNGKGPAVAAERGSLPPILVRMDSGYYDRVAYQIPVHETVTVMSHRRRSLQARGAHLTPPMHKDVIVGSRTVYRNVWHSQSKNLDISPIINRCAEKYALDPWLLRGVIEVESAFRPSARSGVGAGGLMQLMPGTASYLGCRDRFDPEQNISAGARYLRMMMDRFGQPELAIAAYNAGPGNVEKFGGIPPYAETQNYVRKVKRAWQWRP